MGIVHNVCNCTDKPEPMSTYNDKESIINKINTDKQTPGKINVTINDKPYNKDIKKESPIIYNNTTTKQHGSPDKHEDTDEFEYGYEDDDFKDDETVLSSSNLTVENNHLQLSPTDSVNTRWIKKEIIATHKRDSVMKNDNIPLVTDISEHDEDD
eukprot:1004987_1